MEIAMFTSLRLSRGDLESHLSPLLQENGCGFYRMSDAENAVVWNESTAPAMIFDKYNFLFECAIYITGRYSVSVRQENDYWIFNKVEWKTLPPERATDSDDFTISQQFLSDGTIMRFYTQYLAADCCKFQTLRPGWTAFIGFEKGE